MHMTSYTVVYQDTVGYQKTTEIDAKSRKDAAICVVQNDILSRFEAMDISISVYQTNYETMEDANVFDAVTLLSSQ